MISSDRAREVFWKLQVLYICFALALLQNCPILNFEKEYNFSLVFSKCLLICPVKICKNGSTSISCASVDSLCISYIFLCSHSTKIMTWPYMCICTERERERERERLDYIPKQSIISRPLEQRLVAFLKKVSPQGSLAKAVAAPIGISLIKCSVFEIEFPS